MWKLSEQARALVQQLHELLSSTSWFGRAQREENIIVLLDRISNQGEPGAVCSVARCLFESPQVKTTASRSIHHLLSLVSPDQLVHLSGVIGRSWSWYISEAWDKLTPKGISFLLANLESSAAVLGLLSFHRNGFVRQEAVRRLALETAGHELCYLLIRQNDWVGAISDEAQGAVQKKLVPSYLTHFVKCLPLVIHLLAFKRRDLSSVVNQVVGMLVEPRHDALLAEVITASSLAVRRRVVQVALELPGEHRARVIDHGLSSADAIVRLACAKLARQCLVGPDLHQTTIELQQDRHMPVRREGFRIEAEGNPDAASSTWRRALLDPHASNRELARYSLEQIGAFDAAAFYRQRLSEQGISWPAVSGLADCGDQTDLSILQCLLAHSQPKYRRVAIRGIARIARELAVDDLVRMLRDRSPSVVREAKTQLQSFLNDVPGEAVFSIVNEADTEHARRSAVQLIFDKGKWQSLPWLIRIASLVDEAVALSARRLIAEWFSPPLCNKVFTKPSVAERKAMADAMETFPKDDQFFGEVQKWLRAL